MKQELEKLAFTLEFQISKEIDDILAKELENGYVGYLDFSIVNKGTQKKQLVVEVVYKKAKGITSAPTYGKDNIRYELLPEKRGVRLIR